MKNILKRATALMLSLLMVFSVCSTSLVIYAQDAATPDVDLSKFLSSLSAESTEKTINYVSIGDSMTNGYGLDGYTAEAGVYDYGYYSYANQFAAALAGLSTEEFNALAENAEQGFGIQFNKNGVTVNHAQLGLSAARPEDVNFLLNLDWENDYDYLETMISQYPENEGVWEHCSEHGNTGTPGTDFIYCEECYWNHVPGLTAMIDEYPAWWIIEQGDEWLERVGYGDFWTWKELAEDYRFGTATTYIKSIFGTEDEQTKADAYIAGTAGKKNAAKPRWIDYSNGAQALYVAEHYQEQIANADVVSLGIGNGNFGVWLMGRITDILMNGAEGCGNILVYDLDRVMAQLDENDPLLPVINNALEEVDPYVDAFIASMIENISDTEAVALKSIFTYAIVSFIVNYKSMVESILKLNPDVEIVLMGLMNTYAGDELLAEEGQATIGSILDVLFPILNAYIAMVPPTVINAGLADDATFYYAEEYEIECLIQNFGDEDFYAWKGVARDRFFVGIVGECDCGSGHAKKTECDDWDDGLLWPMLTGFDMGGVEIQAISIADVKAYEALTPAERIAKAFTEDGKDWVGSVAIYLAIEEAICKSGRLAPVTLSTLTELSLDSTLLEPAINSFNTELDRIIDTYEVEATAALNACGVDPAASNNLSDAKMLLALKDALSTGLWSNSLLCSMLAVVARNKLGNGLGAHPSVNGHAALAAEMISAYENGYTYDDEIDALPQKGINAFYKFLSKSPLATTPEKVALLKGVYAVVKGETTLGENPEVAVAEEVYSALSEKGYINDEQTLAIILCVYSKALDKTLEGDIITIVQEVYETILLKNGLSAEQKIDIILTVCDVINDNKVFNANFDTFVKVAKDLVAKKQLSPLQAFAIVHLVYLAFTNDGMIDKVEYRVIANIIYYIILGKPVNRRGPGIDWENFTIDVFNDPENGFGGDFEKLFDAVQQDAEVIQAKDSAQKVAIIQAVIEAVPEEVKKDNKQVGAVVELAEVLTGANNKEQLLTNEQAAAIIDSAFSNFVEIKGEGEEIDTTEAITNITQTVVEQLVGMEPEKFDKVMGAIQETVGQLGGTEGEGGEGGSGIVIPEITIPDEVKYANELAYILEQEGLIDDAQRGALVKELTSVLFGKTTDPMDLIDNIYSIIYKEGFDIETTVKFVVVIATFAYEKRDVAFNYANPYYAQAMAAVLTDENIDIAIDSIDSAIAAIDSAIAALSGKARANMGDTTALKAALVAELGATKATLEHIKVVLESDALKNKTTDEYEIQATIAALLTFEEDLWAHANNIAKIATEAGIFAMPYIQYALETINHYAGVAAGVAQNAYNWCVANVQGFVEDYLALVDTISTEISTKFDPTVGAAVRDFMINTPADALAIIYTAGADAVEKLVDRAVNYGNAVADAAIDLALVIKKYGVAIYNAIVDDPACKALYEELLGVVDQILALEDQIKKPSDIEDVALDIYGKLDKLQAYAIDLAGRFYDAAIAAVKADDYLAGTELEDAINALVAALATIDDETIDYAKWLGQHAGEMGGALLASLLENWDALYTASWPIIKDKAEALYDYVKDYILNYDYEALIQKIIDAAIKIAPEVDAYLYDFFYNNPEKVIEFFNEYGDEIVELLEKYGPYALGVIGVALVTYGPTLVDYIIDNHEAVIAGLNAWANKYGDRVVAILQVYAEALGICDIVREEIADLEAKRDALVAQLKVLNAQLQTAVGEAREAILAEIAKVQAELARVQAKIAELQVKLQAVIDEISNLEEALKKFANEAVATAVAAVTEAIANLNKAVKDLLASVSDDVAVKLEQLLNSGKELTVELLKDLADLIIETAVKYAPIIDEALYDYFYNNPEEVIAFFNEYGDDIIELCKKYGDEALAIIGTALYLYGDDLAAYVIENPDEVLAGLNAWADKYGDRVVAILQVYAEALGLCDAVREEIADLEAKRDALVAQLKALNAQLQNAIGEAKKVIEAEIAKVQAELARVQAKLDELNAKLQALVNTIYQLNDALKQFVTDSIENATAAVIAAIDNLNKAVKDLLGSVSDDVAAKLEQLIKTGIGLTKELIADLAKLAVEAVIKFAPELDAYLYDYFYNNPEEVIAFFNEYGDEIIELCKKHGDKALAVVALALAYYGPELAEYIINNPEDVLAGICAWADKYGDRVVAILQVYAEALGLCDAVRGEVDALNDKLAALQAELMKQLNILQNELQAELNDLYAQLKDAVDAQKAIILEKIKEIESKIELVQQYIAELQAKIAELQVMIAELNAKLQALINAIYNLDDALKTLINVGIEAGIAGVQSALNAVAVAIRDLVGVVSGDIAAQIDQLLAKAKDYLNNAYNSAIIADYVIDNMSNYVALGDNKAYADLFAQYLINEVAKADVGYTYKVNTALVQNGSKINTLPVIINTNLNAIAGADLISIGYSFDKIAENTMLMAIELLMDGKTSVPTDFNWATLVGAEAGAEVEKLVAEIYAIMLNEGLGISIAEATGGLFASELLLADVVITAVEYFAYSAIEYAAYLPQAVGMINQINPDAIIMINAISNPISGAKLSFFGQELVFGDYLDYVCDAIYVETAVLATMYENVVFVPTTEVETTLTDYTISMNSSHDLMTLAQLLTALMENQAINTTPNGNAYVCEKMADALNITVKDSALLGDVNHDGEVTLKDALLIARYEIGLTNDLDLTVADVDGDGYIGIKDAFMVARYEIGLVTSFPAAK